MIQVRQGKPADHAGYLRSRIRPTRALTTLAPALSVGITIALLEPAEVESPARPIVAVGAFLAYALAFIMKVSSNEIVRGIKPPRTLQLVDRDSYEAYRSRIEYGDADGCSIRKEAS